MSKDVNVESILDVIKYSMELEKSDRISGALDQYDWDSIAVITFLSQINEQFNVVIKPAELAKASTVEEVVDLAMSNIESTV